MLKLNHNTKQKSLLMQTAESKKISKKIWNYGVYLKIWLIYNFN